MSWTFVIYFILQKQIKKEHILIPPKYSLEQNKKKTKNKPYDIIQTNTDRKYILLICNNSVTTQNL